MPVMEWNGLHYEGSAYDPLYTFTVGQQVGLMPRKHWTKHSTGQVLRVTATQVVVHSAHGDELRFSRRSGHALGTHRDYGTYSALCSYEKAVSGVAYERDRQFVKCAANRIREVLDQVNPLSSDAAEVYARAAEWAAALREVFPNYI